MIRDLATRAMALAAATIALELTGTPVRAEAAQLPASLPCDVADGWNAWNGTSAAWECSGGVVTRVELNSKNLTGTLPASWSTMTAVTHM